MPCRPTSNMHQVANLYCKRLLQCAISSRLASCLSCYNHGPVVPRVCNSHRQAGTWSLVLAALREMLVQLSKIISTITLHGQACAVHNQIQSVAIVVKRVCMQSHFLWILKLLWDRVAACNRNVPRSPRRYAADVCGGVGDVLRAKL